MTIRDGTRTQIREEVSFTKGRIIVRGKLVSRGKGKRADYILSVKPNIPIALPDHADRSEREPTPNGVNVICRPTNSL